MKAFFWVCILLVIIAPVSWSDDVVNQPVNDYIREMGIDERLKSDVMSIVCDVDQDGISDYFISDGSQLKNKIPTSVWIFYHGLPDGNYRRFLGARDLDDPNPFATVGISFHPSRYEIGVVPEIKKWGVTTYLQKRYPDDSGRDATFRYVYFMNGDSIARKLVEKFNDDEREAKVYTLKSSETTVDAYRKETMKLLEAESNKGAVTLPESSSAGADGRSSDQQIQKTNIDKSSSSSSKIMSNPSSSEKWIWAVVFIFCLLVIWVCLKRAKLGPR